MDYNYEKPARKNYAKYPEESYQQPATATVSYGYEQNYEQNESYNTQDQNYSGYDQSYAQEPVTQEGYKEQNYEAEPSLSDYNSHEC